MAQPRRWHAVTTAKRCTADGHSFGSKAERRYYHELVALRESGDVAWFLLQVPLHLGFDAAGKAITYRVDFLEARADGTLRFVDVKGKTTPMTREHDLKTRLVSDRYPFDIEIERR